MVKVNRSVLATNRVVVGHDLVLPRQLVVSGKESKVDGVDAEISMVAVWSDGAQEYEVSKLEVARLDGGAPITGTTLRSIPVQNLLRSAVSLTARYKRPTQSGGYELVAVAQPQEAWRALAASGPTPETLEWVARVYLMAKAQLDPPTKSVGEAFELAPRTASHWVRLARDRGHL